MKVQRQFSIVALVLVAVLYAVPGQAFEATDLFFATIDVVDTQDMGTLDTLQQDPECDAPEMVGFGADVTSGEAPLTVNFEAEVIAPPTCLTGVSWVFGDGSTGEGMTVPHTYTSPGKYTVSTTAHGPEGSDTMYELDYIIVTTDSAADDDDDDDDDESFEPTVDDDSDEDSSGSCCG